MKLHRTLAATAAAGIALVIGVGGATSAFASEGDGNCTSNDAGAGGDLCLYYNSNLQGARFNDPYTDNYAGWVFVAWSGGSAGAGQPVKNNAASVANYDPYATGIVYYNSNQAGPNQSVAPNSWINFNSTLKNENASQGW